MKRLIALCVLVCGVAGAAPTWFILPDGDGTISVKYRPSWNTPQDWPGQLAKLFSAPDTPAVAAKYWTWDGTNVVEAAQAVKDAVDAAELAARERDPTEKAIQTRIKTIVEAKWGYTPPYNETQIRTVITDILTEMNDARNEMNAASTTADIKTAISKYMIANSVLQAVNGYLNLQQILNDRDMQDSGFGGDYEPLD